MKKKKLRCYTYVRVSTSMQVDGYSLEAQRERLLRFAEFQEMEVVREYCDAGKSGKNISGRPEFSQMLQDIAEDRDRVDFILVFKLSRFGRNAADVLNSLQYIQDFGVNLICVEDGIDSSKDSGKLTITVLSAVAEIERENILVQTMEGRRQKAREGKWNGGQAPFGYELDSKNGTLTVNSKEAEIVKIIFSKFVNEGLGADSICDYLNQHRYQKKKVKKNELNYFSRGLIMKILDNPVYIGKIAYGRTATEKVKGSRDQYKRVKTDDYMLIDGIHEAIVDQELWEAARIRRKETGVKWNKTHSLEHEHILSGILRCPVCGSGLVGTVRRRKNKKSGEYKDDFYYKCLHRKKIDDIHFCNFRLVLNQDEINHQTEEIILDMVADPEFRDYMVSKLDEKVDVSALETEKNQIMEQLRQVMGAKKKLTEMMERLDIGDKHYDRKYQDMQDRQNVLYDRISELEEAIADIEVKISGAYEEKITTDQLYKILLNFDKMYYKMSDLEKKRFMREFIEGIELYPEKQKDGRILKQISLGFPVFYEGSEGDTIWLHKENTAETVVLLSKLNAKQHIEVELNLDELDLTDAEKKATYQEIKDYVLEHSGLKVSSLYIAQVKQKCGIIERENYNKPKSENVKQPQCPPEKEKAIKEALKHFGMV